MCQNDAAENLTFLESNSRTFMTSPPDDSVEIRSKQDAYWSSSLRIVGLILACWAFISLGCGILFRDFLDAMLPNIGGAPFGFWMAQQGSIIGFLILLFAYLVLMNGLDRKHGFGEENPQ